MVGIRPLSQMSDVLNDQVYTYEGDYGDTNISKNISVSVTTRMFTRTISTQAQDTCSAGRTADVVYFACAFR